MYFKLNFFRSKISNSLLNTILNYFLYNFEINKQDEQYFLVIYLIFNSCETFEFLKDIEVLLNIAFSSISLQNYSFFIMNNRFSNRESKTRKKKSNDETFFNLNHCFLHLMVGFGEKNGILKRDIILPFTSCFEKNFLKKFGN